jgi:hypothetical protein
MIFDENLGLASDFNFDRYISDIIASLEVGDVTLGNEALK